MLFLVAFHDSKLSRFVAVGFNVSVCLFVTELLYSLLQWKSDSLEQLYSLHERIDSSLVPEGRLLIYWERTHVRWKESTPLL
jgi:hypothetical protein